jgi:hypothetical protein
MADASCTFELPRGPGERVPAVQPSQRDATRAVPAAGPAGSFWRRFQHWVETEHDGVNGRRTAA